MAVQIGSMQVMEVNGRQYVWIHSLGGTISVAKVTLVHLTLAKDANAAYEAMIADSEE